jgi:hypothetical protein
VSRRIPSFAVAATLFGLFAAPAAADDFDREPINYSTATPDNAVAALQRRLDAGEATLEHSDRFGYLPAVLEALGVPQSSQTLVFSKTSLQRERIAPRTPRAIYFSDDVYVGYCRQGPVMEVSAVDPQLGAVFYTLDQQRSDAPRFVRQTDNCLLCHASSRTEGVPGHLVRSVYADRGGFPVLSAGSYRTDHTSPLAERWGGWYVTGTHGDQPHLGNRTFTDRTAHEPAGGTEGQNVLDVSDHFNTDHYLTPHSDIVALLVLEHQVMGHNLIARAGFLARQALHHEAELNRQMGEPPDHRWDSTDSRLRSAAEPLVKFLLMSGEAPLTARVAGTSEFAREFPLRGPRDARGRSLRDFDLQRRMFRVPCSYLIHSPAFDALPAEVRDRVWDRLAAVLRGDDASGDFAHLSAEDREAIGGVLRETRDGVTPDWPETEEE